MPPESSAARVAGKTFRTFTFDGKSYLLSQPLRMASYADEEALVLWKRRDPGEFGLRMVAILQPTAHAAVWEGCARAAMAGIPSREEWAAWNSSRWKQAYMLWHTLDPKHKIDNQTKQPISLIDGVQWAVDFIGQVMHSQTEQEPGSPVVEGTYEDLLLKLAAVSQDAAIKNSSGRTVPAEPAPDPAMENRATTVGQPSTSISPSGLDTDPTR